MLLNFCILCCLHRLILVRFCLISESQGFTYSMFDNQRRCVQHKGVCICWWDFCIHFFDFCIFSFFWRATYLLEDVAGLGLGASPHPPLQQPVELFRLLLARLVGEGFWVNQFGF